MAAELPNILAIDPGSTSTKFALYAGEKPLLVRTLRHSEETLAAFKGKRLIDQSDFRREAIQAELEKEGFRATNLAAVVGRGGLLKPLASGTYRVTPKMLDDLRTAERGEHAANLGAFLAQILPARRTRPPSWSIRSLWTNGRRERGFRAWRSCRDNAFHTL